MLDNEFPPLGGGMGTANHALFKCFEKKEHIKIDLITSALNGDFQVESFSNNIEIYKVPVWNRNIHHSSNRELILYSIFALWYGIKLYRTNHYDFCFAWSTVPAGFVAFILNILFRFPYAVWVSGPDIPGFEERYKTIYKLLKPVLLNVWRNAEYVIAKCQEEVEMIHLLDNNLDITIIPNGVDIQKFNVKTNYGNGSKLKILNVARLIERKGQHHLIQAVKLLDDDGIDVELDLVGTGDSLEAFQHLSVKLEIEHKIHFIGFIPREEIPKFYQAADLFVLPSYNEGMSLAALEAMSSGLPVVLSKTGGTYDLVEEGVNGYTFEWGEISKLTQIIREFSKKPDLLVEMGKASRQRAEDYSWENISEEFKNIFSSFCSDCEIEKQKSI